MSVLVLPGSLSLNSSLIKQKFNAIEHYKKLEIDKPTTLDLIDHIKSLSLSPEAIIGSTQTPVIDWLATQYLFPKADIYLQQTRNEELQIRKIDSSELMHWIKPQVENKVNQVTTSSDNVAQSNKNKVPKSST